MATAKTNPESLNEMIFISSSILINLFETTYRNCIAILTFLDKAACCKHRRSALLKLLCVPMGETLRVNDDDVEKILYCAYTAATSLGTNLVTTDILLGPT